MNSSTEGHLGIAVVDDDEIFLDHTCALLRHEKNYSPFPAKSGHELFDILSNRHVDCVLLDYNLGFDNGIVIKNKMEAHFLQIPPVIMITGDARTSTAIEAFRMGVSDYIPKMDLRPSILVASISKAVMNARNPGPARRERVQLTAATIDPITGLAGQAYLDEQLTRLSNLNPIDRECYVVLAVTLFEYNLIVYYYGRDVAERVLRSFGQRLKMVEGSSDICGRYAEGNFLIIKKYGSAPNIEGICNGLSEFLSFSVDTSLVKLKVSAKVTIADAEASATDEWSVSLAPPTSGPERRPPYRLDVPERGVSRGEKPHFG